MPKSAAMGELVEAIRASRLVAEPRLREALDRAAPPGADTAAALLDALVAAGLLTPFQAGRLARGCWRGLVLGSYRLLAPLGKGGSGVVYRAEHRHTGRVVAVKVLAAAPAGARTARARLAREARAASAVDHPNVVRVYDVEPDADPPYLVMEFVDGVTLQVAVARGGPLPPAEAAGLAAQVARGLQAVADAGLVHRDVKPANVLLDRAGGCKLLDLGVVRVDGAGELTSQPGTRTILGTADYLAPEQALDSTAVDARADVYALGGTLYFLLTGRSPFPDGSAVAKLLAKQRGGPPRLDSIRPGLPPGLADAVHRLLARDPAERPPTPAAAAELLAPFAAADTLGHAALAAAPPAACAAGTLDEDDGVPTLPLSVSAAGPFAFAPPPRFPAPRSGLTARRTAAVLAAAGALLALAAVTRLDRPPPDPPPPPPPPHFIRAAR